MGSCSDGYSCRSEVASLIVSSVAALHLGRYAYRTDEITLHSCPLCTLTLFLDLGIAL